MMSGYTVEFNVYQPYWNSTGFSPGHMNVTLRGPDGESYTIGANSSRKGLGLIRRGCDRTDDGIIKREDDRLNEDPLTRGVPVTAEQFAAIKDALEALENTGYDYALFGSLFGGEGQACTDWANRIYQATGHPGEVGDLFSFNDRIGFRSPVWYFVPGAPESGIPIINPVDPNLPDYVPTGPIAGHIPNVQSFKEPLVEFGPPLYKLGCLLPDLSSLFGLAENMPTPLILDLDGDGVETLGHDYDITFDHDKNGLAERTGWVAADDGLLVLDRNGNGWIDNGSELFGNNSGTGTGWANGFDALAEFDSNLDGSINASDTVFASLRVWKDANSNGRTDADELLTLQQAGVGSLSLSYTNGTAVDAQGNSHLQLGSTTTTQGQTRQMTDVWFSVDTMRAGGRRAGRGKARGLLRKRRAAALRGRLPGVDRLTTTGHDTCEGCMSRVGSTGRVGSFGGGRDAQGIGAAGVLSCSGGVL
jgi:hypothetical protein